MKRRDLLLISVIAAAYIMAVSYSAYAQATPIFRLKNPKVRFSVPPGGTGASTIDLENPTERDIPIRVYVEDWKYSSADGQKDFLAPNTTAYSCASWINFFPKDFVMPAFGKTTINLIVDSPAETKDGRYAVLFFETPLSQKTPEGDMVALNVMARLGALVYVEPEGMASRNVEVKDISVDFDKKKGYVIKASLVNNGNVDSTVEGSFDIIDSSGQVFGRGKFNNSYMLQGDKAEIEASWSEKLPQGRYDLIMSLDDSGSPIIKEMAFEVNPEGAATRDDAGKI